MFEKQNNHEAGAELHEISRPVWRYEGILWKCIAHGKHVCVPCNKVAKHPFSGATGQVWPPVPESSMSSVETIPIVPPTAASPVDETPQEAIDTLESASISPISETAAPEPTITAPKAQTLHGQEAKVSAAHVEPVPGSDDIAHSLAAQSAKLPAKNKSKGYAVWTTIKVIVGLTIFIIGIIGLIHNIGAL